MEKHTSGQRGLFPLIQVGSCGVLDSCAGQLWWTVMECWKTEVDRCAVIIGQLLDSCGVVSGQLLCDFWTAVLDSCCAGQLWCDYWTAVLDSSQQCVSLCCHSWCLRVQLTGLPGLNLHLHLHPQPGDSKPHCSIITRVITVVEDLMSFSFLSPLILSSHLHQPAWNISIELKGQHQLPLLTLASSSVEAYWQSYSLIWVINEAHPRLVGPRSCPHLSARGGCLCGAGGAFIAFPQQQGRWQLSHLSRR